MAEDKYEARETNWRQLLPWTALFQGFRVALDVNKLLLAAAGILVMAFGWWLLGVIFSPSADSATRNRTNEVTAAARPPAGPISNASKATQGRSIEGPTVSGLLATALATSVRLRPASESAMTPRRPRRRRDRLLSGIRKLSARAVPF